MNFLFLSMSRKTYILDHIMNMKQEMVSVIHFWSLNVIDFTWQNI